MGNHRDPDPVSRVVATVEVFGQKSDRKSHRALFNLVKTAVNFQLNGRRSKTLVRHSRVPRLLGTPKPAHPNGWLVLSPARCPVLEELDCPR